MPKKKEPTTDCKKCFFYEEEEFDTKTIFTQQPVHGTAIGCTNKELTAEEIDLHIFYKTGICPKYKLRTL